MLIKPGFGLWRDPYAVDISCSIFDLTTQLYPAYFLPLASLGNLTKVHYYATLLYFTTMFFLDITAYRCVENERTNKNQELGCDTN